MLLKQNRNIYSYFNSLKCIVHFFNSILQRGGRGPISSTAPPPNMEDDAELPDVPFSPRRKIRASRRLIPCHLCPAKVKKLTRHIRQVHGCSRQRTHRATSRFIRGLPSTSENTINSNTLIKSLVNQSNPVVLSPER